MSLNLFSCHSSTPMNYVSPPLLFSLSSSLLLLPSLCLPPSDSLPSPQHMTEMYGKLHSAFRKVVDIMATGKRYLGTYFRVAFFGKVGHATVHLQSTSLASSRTAIITSSSDPLLSTLLLSFSLPSSSPSVSLLPLYY